MIVIKSKIVFWLVLIGCIMLVAGIIIKHTTKFVDIGIAIAITPLCIVLFCLIVRLLQLLYNDKL